MRKHTPVEKDARASYFSPGCGEMTGVPGTNGGKMTCGSVLKDLTGNRKKQLCAGCSDYLSKHLGVVNHLGAYKVIERKEVTA